MTRQDSTTTSVSGGSISPTCWRRWVGLPVPVRRPVPSNRSGSRSVGPMVRLTTKFGSAAMEHCWPRSPEIPPDTSIYRSPSVSTPGRFRELPAEPSVCLLPVAFSCSETFAIWSGRRKREPPIQERLSPMHWWPLVGVSSLSVPSLPYQTSIDSIESGYNWGCFPTTIH